MDEIDLINWTLKFKIKNSNSKLTVFFYSLYNKFFLNSPKTNKKPKSHYKYKTN